MKNIVKMKILNKIRFGRPTSEESQNRIRTSDVRKNILIATGLFPPDIGGPATYSKLLVDELPKYGFNVRVVSFGEVRHLPKFFRHIVYFFKIIRRSWGVDVIFAQDPVSVGLPAMLASKILRKRFVLKIVGDYAWEQLQVQSEKRKAKSNNEKFVNIEEFQSGRYDLLTEARRKIERWVAKNAKEIIVPSNFLKKIVSLWGVDEKRIRVIYNGLKDISDQGNREIIRKMLNFGGKFIISAGRLVPWKGFRALIEIMPEIIKKFPDLPTGKAGVKLFIAGDGPERNVLMQLVEKLNLNEHIAFGGSMRRDVLLRYISASDIFVLNTAYEGFSHQLLEAMSLGSPIVTTNIGGNPEIIKDGENGLLVGYNDKQALEKSIYKILSDKQYANKLSENGKKRVREFSENRMIEETVKILGRPTSEFGRRTS